MKYEIKGGAFPVVVCYLDNGETMITEKGSMVWQTPNMMMSTTGGGIGKMFSKMCIRDSTYGGYSVAAERFKISDTLERHDPGDGCPGRKGPKLE